jgi:DTW domain-containing protein YfiP
MNTIPPEEAQIPAEPITCTSCGREEKYCVCAFAEQIKAETKILILQHPQEPGVDIGTVPIITASLPNTVVRTGLSWPNFSKALGYQAENKRWGVLYMGSVHMEDLPKDRNLFVVDKKGSVAEGQDEILRKLEGIVLLDGTWSQAKTLWWRNAWLLKLPRIVLRPTRHSVYDKIRKEPRKGCVSTAETIGDVLNILERRSDILEAIDKPLTELVARLARNKSSASARQHRRDWRHHRGRPRYR